MNVRLFIDGMEAELSDNTEIAITRQASTIFNLDKRQLDFSNRVVLPATVPNISLMGMLGVNGNGSTRPYKYAPARLEVNGITYADNLVAIVDQIGDNGYEIRLIGNPFDAFQQMKAAQLRDVVDDFFNGGVNNLIPESWILFQSVSPLAGYTFPLIQQSRPFPGFPKTRLYIDLTYPAFWTEALLGNILNKYFTDVQSGIDSDLISNDLTFAADTQTTAWKEWELVKVEKTDDVVFFFTPLLSSIWFGYYFYAEIDNKNNLVDEVQSGLDPDGFKFDDDGLTVFKVPSYRKYTLKISSQFDIGNISASQRYRLEVYSKPRANALIDPTSDTLVAASDWYTSNGTYTIQNEIDIVLRANRDLYFLYKTENATTQVNLTIRDFKFDLIPLEQAFMYDATFNSKLLLPDCTQFDYFIDQVKRFGLIFQTKYDGSIRIECFKDVFAGRFGAVDWSNKLVRVTKTGYEMGAYGKTSYLQYKGDREGLLFGNYNGWGFWTADNDRYENEKVVVESKGKALTQAFEWLQPPFENALRVGGFDTPDSGVSQMLTAEKDLIYGRLNQNDEFAQDYDLYVLNEGAFTGDTGEVLRPQDFACNVSLAEMASFVGEFYGNLIDSIERPVVREIEVYLSEVDFYNLDFFKLVYLEQFQKFHYLLSVENYIPGKVVKASLLEVKGQLSVTKTCVYSVEGIYLTTGFTICFQDEYVWNLETGSPTNMFVGNIDGFSFIIPILEIGTYNEDEITYTVTAQNIIDWANGANFGENIFVITEGNCLIVLASFESGVLSYPFISWGNNGSSVATEDMYTITAWYGVGNIIQLRPTEEFPDQLSYSYDSQDAPLPFTFQVLINDTWTDVTDEVINGTWTRTSTDSITQWRIIDAEENVIDSGNVTAVCNF